MNEIVSVQLAQIVLSETIVSKIPYVSGISENSPVELPEQPEAILGIDLNLEITCLVRNDEERVLRRGSRADRTCLPTSQAACTAAVELLLERH